MKKNKSDFTIEQIGRFRFFSGIIVGLIFSITLYVFFLNLIKVKDVLEAMNNGYYKTPFSEHPDFYHSFFWSLFSISLGFCFTIYLWTSKPTLKNRRETRINRIAHLNSLFVFGFIFLCAFRLLELYMAFHFVDLEIKDYLGNLLFIVPVFIYVYNWLFILRIYKSIKSFLISLLLFVIFGLILSLIIV